MRRPTVLVLIALALSLTVPTACGTSGRHLSDPVPGATAPPRKPPAAGTMQATSTTSKFFGLSSDAWTPGGPLPTELTCDGTDVSPPLVISSVPSDAVELVLVVRDPDADGFVHWIVAGIPPTTDSFVQATVPPGAVEAENSAGTAAWSGPCPPKGESHTYEFTLYALAIPSGITQDATTASAVASLSTGAVETALLTGTYKRR